MSTCDRYYVGLSHLMSILQVLCDLSHLMSTHPVIGVMYESFDVYQVLCT